jgi:heme-binding NEAT domain protein
MPTISPSKKKSKKKKKKPRKKKEYLPKNRSGAWSILITLFLEKAFSKETAMKKNDIIKKGQPLCNSSFTAVTSTFDFLLIFFRTTCF